MSDFLVVGDALGVLEVQQVPLTAYDAATTYKITIGGKVVSVLGTGGTTTTTAVALAAALAASEINEFQEFTWTSSTNNLIATANEDEPVGKPHTIVPSVSGGTGTIDPASVTTSAKGAEALTAENVKSTAGVRALPGNGDVLYIGQLDGNLRFALNALAAVTTLTTHFLASLTGECGLPFTNEDNDPYNEYRTRYYTTNGGTFVIGRGEGAGSGRIMIDALGSAATFHVITTAESEDDDQHACVIKGTNAGNTLIAEGGSVDIAPHAGELSTFVTVTATGGAIVRTSRGTTLTDVIADNQAQVTIDSPTALANIASITVHGSATVILLGDNTIVSLVLDGTAPSVQFKPSAALAITACTMNAGAILDLDSCPSLVTIATLTVKGLVTIKDANAKLKITNAVAGFYALVTYIGPPGRSFSMEDP